MNLSSILTILVALGLLVVILALVRSYRQWRPAPVRPDGEGNQINPRLASDFGPTVTSRRLVHVAIVFTLLFITALGFHLYWALFAVGPLRSDKAYATLRYREDNRRRREAETTLRGWIFDRHHDTSRTLARYRYDNGRLIRDYQLGEGAFHLVGYSNVSYEDASLEKAIIMSFDREGEGSLTGRLEALVREPNLPLVGLDLVTTIDFELQREAYELIRKYHGAVIVINPQNGQLLALASSPAIDPALPLKSWSAQFEDRINRPSHNRATHARYSPGSTFKTLVAAAAIESNLDRQVFTCRSGGWVPPGASRPIRDDDGEEHGQVDLTEAFTHSCNQYFAQMGVLLERQRLGEAASRFGFELFAEPRPSIAAVIADQFWNVGNPAISSVLAPLRSSFVSGQKVARVDLALESIGQGFVQATPLQMALVAAGVANLNGQIMQPAIELDRRPVVMSQPMSAGTAARVRQLMAQVVRRGTASKTILPVLGQVSAGGKTGTAQREVAVLDPRTGKPLKYTDKDGKDRPRLEKLVDSWFIGFAPVENPQIAFAVFVENGGYGSTTAAPIAGRIIQRARQTGLIQ